MVTAPTFFDDVTYYAPIPDVLTFHPGLLSNHLEISNAVDCVLADLGRGETQSRGGLVHECDLMWYRVYKAS